MKSTLEFLARLEAPQSFIGFTELLELLELDVFERTNFLRRLLAKTSENSLSRIATSARAAPASGTGNATFAGTAVNSAVFKSQSLPGQAGFKLKTTQNLLKIKSRNSLQLQQPTS